MGTEGKEDQPLQHTPNHAPIIAVQSAGLDASYNPAGGLYMSVCDWGKFCQWILIIEAGHHQSILKDETARELTKPVADEGCGWKYAFGWGVGDQDWAGGKSLQHNGSNTFNYSTVWLAPQKHFGIIIMTNQGAIGEEWPLEKPFWRILEFYQKGK
jgi:CubicO group peptidase (beta-lactamase class C family)